MRLQAVAAMVPEGAEVLDNSRGTAPGLWMEHGDRVIVLLPGPPREMRALFEEAAQKLATIPKEPFKDSWPYLQAMLRLIRAYFRGEYRNVSQDALVFIVAAVSYLVDPFDLIPDEIPFLGFLDDATVVAFAVARTRESLDDFMIWETTAL